ncbi:MAG: hypothetical protein ACR2O8_05315 [Rhizobiaceae bacterium]
MMSDTTMYVLLVIVGLVVAAMCAYIAKGRAAQKKNPNAFRWQPEQDYDVVMQGETPMTPGFPILKKRKKRSSKAPSRQSIKD